MTFVGGGVVVVVVHAEEREEGSRDESRSEEWGEMSKWIKNRTRRHEGERVAGIRLKCRKDERRGWLEIGHES